MYNLIKNSLQPLKNIYFKCTLFLSHLHISSKHIDLNNEFVHTLHASTRLVSMTICVIFSCQIILQKSANIAFVGPTWIQN